MLDNYETKQRPRMIKTNPLLVLYLSLVSFSWLDLELHLAVLSGCNLVQASSLYLAIVRMEGRCRPLLLAAFIAAGLLEYIDIVKCINLLEYLGLFCLLLSLDTSQGSPIMLSLLCIQVWS